MNTYEVVVELKTGIKTYDIMAPNVYEAYNRAYEMLTQKHETFNIINMSKKDEGTNYNIAEAV